MASNQMLLIQFFFTNFIILGGTAFVAFFTVRDSLNVSKKKIYLGTFVFTLAYTSLSTLFDAFYLQGVPDFVRVLFYIHPIVAVIGGAILYFKFVDEARDKLAFMLLLVAHCAFFCYDVAHSTYWVSAETKSGNVQILSLLIPFVVFYPLLARILQKLWLNINMMENMRWLRLCLLPIMFIALSFLVRNVFEFNTGIRFLHSAVVLVVDICAMVTYFMLISALTLTHEKVRIESDLRSLNDNLSLQASRMDDLTAHIEEVKRLRHDMRHHLLALDGMLESGRTQAARDYLSRLRQDTPERGALPLCLNYTADSIASRYLAVAEQQGICVETALSISEEPGIAHTDLGIVLGNLLENAVEACSRQKHGEKFIRAEAREEDGSLMIQVLNSFDGAIKERNGVFLSSKRGGEAGMGIRSVAAIAEKYKGLARFAAEGNTFRASVLLYPVPSAGSPADKPE